jgi:hypothetical protein
VYVLETVYNVVIENKVKELCNNSSDLLYGKRVTLEYNGKNQTELIQLDNNFTIEHLWNKVLYIEKSINKDEIFIQMENRIETLEKEIEHLKNSNVKTRIINLLNEDKTFPVLIYNITDKKTTKLDTLADAKRHFNSTVDPLTIKNYINVKKQLNGNVLRSEKNDTYWMLPDNFKFCGVIKQTTQSIFIKRVNKVTKEVVYFNSITEASLYLQQELDSKEITGETKESYILKKALGELLRNLPTRKAIINKYKWYKMKEIGYIVDKDNNKTCIDEEYTSNINEKDPEEEQNETKETKPQEEKEKTDEIITDQIKEKKKKSIKPKVKLDDKIPVIVTNLDTGEETLHESGFSYSEFVKKYGMRKDAFEKYVNMPHNYKNYTIRTIDSPKWIPPNTYMRNAELDNSRVDYYLKIINKKTQEVTYHHSITDAVLSLFPNEDKGNMVSTFTKKMSGRRNPGLLVDFDIFKLETCGKLVHKDGTEEDIEKEFVKEDSGTLIDSEQDQEDPEQNEIEVVL